MILNACYIFLYFLYIREFIKNGYAVIFLHRKGSKKPFHRIFDKCIPSFLSVFVPYFLSASSSSDSNSNTSNTTISSTTSSIMGEKILSEGRGSEQRSSPLSSANQLDKLLKSLFKGMLIYLYNMCIIKI